MARKKEKAIKKEEEKGKKSEKVCEIFEVGKDNKEEEIKACGDIPIEPVTKEQLDSQNKILRNFLITIGVLIILALFIIYFLHTVGDFEYRGLPGKIVKEGNLILYQFTFPYTQEDITLPYYVYTRNDPRKLDKDILFNGEMDFGGSFSTGMKYRLVLNLTEKFYCDGYGILSIANMNNLKAIGVKILVDPNATCDSLGRYMFLNFVPGNKTEINQIGNSCYELSINNCEILKGTERFMAEMFVKYNEDSQ